MQEGVGREEEKREELSSAQTVFVLLLLQAALECRKVGRTS